MEFKNPYIGIRVAVQGKSNKMTQRQLLESDEEFERTLIEVREDLQMLPEIDKAVKEIMDNMNRLLQQMEE
ncbi:unnamed protein product [Citrullus colocynthis]|uniref:Uncharacterized protein n=1 Tax=Citrullus colocynthis TaxID=252529 RepID=A0ABP0XMQ4_9ROSI